jgi:hypothetical protein
VDQDTGFELPTHFEITVGIEQEVGRLQISMNDYEAVDRVGHER